MTQTASANTLLRREGDVALIELNRPERRNAMSLGLRQELVDRLIELEEDDRASAIVITGSGDKAFSAGADLHELRERTVESELGRSAELRRRLPALVEGLAKPVIAAVNGACIGAGLELALACDLRIAARTATFGLPEVALGLTPGSGGTQRLTRLVGAGWSMHLTLTGQTVGAEQALGIGLVTQLHEPRDLMPAAVDIAAHLGSHPRLAYTSAREAIRRSLDLDQASGIEFERKLFALCLSTGIPRERADALLARISSP